MKEKILKMNEFFDAEMSECADNFKSLQADERCDEANLEKLRRNVYDIFKTVLDVGVKTRGKDPDAVRDFFLSKLETIPTNWHKAYERAVAHNDDIAVHRESLKLETVEKIRNEFYAVWEAKS